MVARALACWTTLGAAALAAAAACSSFDGSAPFEGEAGIDDASAPDSPSDARSGDAGGEGGDAAPDATCDPAAPWGPASQILVAGAGGDTHATLTDDELTIFFNRLTGVTREAIYSAGRKNIGDVFASPQEETFNGLTDTEDPALSPDGLSLFFTSNRLNGPNNYDLWVVTRPSITSGFLASPSRLGALNSPTQERTASVAANGELWFASDRGGDFDLYRAAALSDGGYAVPALVADVSSSASESSSVHSRDGLTVMFASDRSGGIGKADIWVATRTSPGAALGAPVPVGKLSSSSDDLPAWLSPDQCRLYLTSDRGGSFRVYVASRGK